MRRGRQLPRAAGVQGNCLKRLPPPRVAAAVVSIRQGVNIFLQSGIFLKDLFRRFQSLSRLPQKSSLLFCPSLKNLPDNSAISRTGTRVMNRMSEAGDGVRIGRATVARLGDEPPGPGLTEGSACANASTLPGQEHRAAAARSHYRAAYHRPVSDRTAAAFPPSGNAGGRISRPVKFRSVETGKLRPMETAMNAGPGIPRPGQPEAKAPASLRGTRRTLSESAGKSA
jgi:hypothetical protein